MFNVHTVTVTPVLVIGNLSLWCIYGDPSDFPGKFVVRRWDVGGGTLTPMPNPEPDAVCGTLEEARRALPQGLRNMGRQRNDDAKIVETWI